MSTPDYPRLADRYSLDQIAGANMGIPTNRDSFFNNEILRGRSWKSWIGHVNNIMITGFPSRNCVEVVLTPGNRSQVIVFTWVVLLSVGKRRNNLLWPGVQRKRSTEH
ncbi:hypothetical protein MLD38_036969 [Melastoma candidum]|uniref:Uncharacterized protein n=1 Tax=Melastoma candidum TaxID=119954 RepID=A0ACB9LLK9_9MYRT|nr:hypothetical protein MLD38_036969 [Melastoma candidum]